MKECLVIGRTNVGKTLFTINFADFLGLKKLELLFRYPEGLQTKKTYSTDMARRELTGRELHKTKCLQSITMSLPAGKGVKTFEVIDSCGMSEGIHPEEDVRRAMAQTLAILRYSSLVLHMLDAALIGEQGVAKALGEVDYQIARYAQSKGGYLMLANKIDLLPAREGYSKLRQEFPNCQIIPISALQKTGFKEVKAFVWRNV